MDDSCQFNALRESSYEKEAPGLYKVLFTLFMCRYCCVDSVNIIFVLLFAFYDYLEVWTMTVNSMLYIN